MMKAILEISKLAENDLSEITTYYENISDGLGYRFVDSFSVALDEILLSPEANSPSLFKGEVRRKFIKRFPYNIYYRYFSKRIWFAFLRLSILGVRMSINKIDFKVIHQHFLIPNIIST